MCAVDDGIILMCFVISHCFQGLHATFSVIIIGQCMANSLYETCLQGIMGVVFDKKYQRLGNAEYNYHNFVQAHLIGGNY